jgi:hypothetical protein
MLLIVVHTACAVNPANQVKSSQVKLTPKITVERNQVNTGDRMRIPLHRMQVRDRFQTRHLYRLMDEHITCYAERALRREGVEGILRK